MKWKAVWSNWALEPIIHVKKNNSDGALGRTWEELYSAFSFEDKNAESAGKLQAPQTLITQHSGSKLFLHWNLHHKVSFEETVVNVHFTGVLLHVNPEHVRHPEENPDSVNVILPQSCSLLWPLTRFRRNWKTAEYHPRAFIWIRPSHKHTHTRRGQVNCGTPGLGKHKHTHTGLQIRRGTKHYWHTDTFQKVSMPTFLTMNLKLFHSIQLILAAVSENVSDITGHDLSDCIFYRS